MKAGTARSIPANESPLYAIKGLKGQANNLDALIDAAWNVAQTALWNTSIFSQKEVSGSKEWIGFYLISSKNFYKAYSIFCQRVLLARQYILGDTGRFVPLPSVWLNPENETGFVGTRSWYERVAAIRESLPNHKVELKGFAEAVWEISQEPTAANFHYWRNYFIEAKTTGLLNLYLSTVAALQFKNQ